MFVMFYSNTCGACSVAKPEFEKAATELIEERPALTMAKFSI